MHETKLDWSLLKLTFDCNQSGRKSSTYTTTTTNFKDMRKDATTSLPSWVAATCLSAETRQLRRAQQFTQDLARQHASLPSSLNDTPPFKDCCQLPCPQRYLRADFSLLTSRHNPLNVSRGI